MNGRVLVATGASAGIGAEVARRATAAGASVVLAARSRDKLEAVAVEAGSRAFVVPTDVTVRAEVDALARAAIDRFGQIDVWINNAGRGIARATSDLSDEDVDAMITVSVKSALYGMQAVLPHFKQRGEGQIVNVSSMLGRVPFAPFRSAYCAAKRNRHHLHRAYLRYGCTRALARSSIGAWGPPRLAGTACVARADTIMSTGRHFWSTPRGDCSHRTYANVVVLAAPPMLA